MARSITRWEPFGDLADVRSRFDRLLADLADGEERRWIPAIDMERRDDEIVVSADVPGIKPEEIDIEVDAGVLTISGRHEEAEEHRDKEFLRRERRIGTFSRSMTLPDGVDPEQIRAATQNGVLQVHVPLPKESARQPVKIKATTGS